MNNTITLSRLASNPIIAYSIRIPQAQDLYLTDYERAAYPAVLGNLLGLSIPHVVPHFRFGRVLSFDIQPVNLRDPIIIYSPIGDLSLYYTVWSKVMKNGLGLFRGYYTKKYDEAIKEFVLSSNGLNIQEVVFAVIEMLKFKNDVLLNPNF